MDHLWGTLGETLSRWTLARGDLPPGVWGLTEFDEHRVVIADGLTNTESRCTLAHELVHVERGPAPVWWVAQEEERVSRIAARRLLPDIEAVADAIVWARWDLEQAADELDVDVDTLQWRLRCLDDAGEIEMMQARFADGGEA